MNKILIFLIAVLFYSCDPMTPRLVLVNDTSEKIYYRLLTDTILDPELYLYQAYQAYAFDTVEPNFGIIGIRNYKGWEHKINRQCIDSALHIFIFSTDKITDELIKNKELVLLTDELIKNRDYVRLSYKVKELDSLNWTVVYRGQNKIDEDSIETP